MSVERSVEQRRVDRKIFWEHVACFAMLNGIVAWMKYTTWPAAPWDLWVPLGWGGALALHGLWAYGRLGA
ncbi:MAG TPA: 2TM domain-containing protein [Candidatus Thermoplasmatota archaeon]|nr:2TM domain-containing protein [Candidatus Thermoplasmatota archaeon]